MISISIDPRGYALKISEPGTGWRGYTVIANDLDEVHLAIDHYHGDGDPPHAFETRRRCPLCRQIETEQTAGGFQSPR